LRVSESVAAAYFLYLFVLCWIRPVSTRRRIGISVVSLLSLGAIALVAGGAPDVAIRIGLAMTLLQLGIGTVNDLVDAPFDAGRKAGKPIPAGLVSTAAGRAAAVALFGGGVLLAASVSIALAGLSVVVIGIGLAYDLRLKGTAWSWLPFAVGIPILPVYGWLGAAAFMTGLLAAWLLAALTAIGLLLARRATRKSEIPFGPFLIAATLGVVLASGFVPALAS